MDEKHNTIKKMNNQRGFTLIELIVVIAIISILTAIGFNYYTAIKYKSSDSQAFVEGRNLITAVNSAFLSLEDIDFEYNVPDAGITGLVGKWADGGVPRTPIFTLSPEIRVKLIGQSTPTPGGGYFEAYIWSVNGTPVPVSFFSDGKKEYVYVINENTGDISYPAF